MVIVNKLSSPFFFVDIFNEHSLVQWSYCAWKFPWPLYVYWIFFSIIINLYKLIITVHFTVFLHSSNHFSLQKDLKCWLVDDLRNEWWLIIMFVLFSFFHFFPFPPFFVFHFSSFFHISFSLCVDKIASTMSKGTFWASSDALFTHCRGRTVSITLA